MKFQATHYGFVVRLDRGEEIVATLRDFAAQQGVRCAMISGIGAVGEVELGAFPAASGEYLRQRFDGDHEILALTGNLSELDGAPFPHLHVVLGTMDFAVRGGHLFRGVVSVTCEVQVVTDPEVLLRVRGAGAFSPLEPR